MLQPLAITRPILSIVRLLALAGDAQGRRATRMTSAEARLRARAAERSLVYGPSRRGPHGDAPCRPAHRSPTGDAATPVASSATATSTMRLTAAIPTPPGGPPPATAAPVPAWPAPPSATSAATLPTGQLWLRRTARSGAHIMAVDHAGRQI